MIIVGNCIPSLSHFSSQATITWLEAVHYARLFLLISKCKFCIQEAKCFVDLMSDELNLSGPWRLGPSRYEPWWIMFWRIVSTTSMLQMKLGDKQTKSCSVTTIRALLEYPWKSKKAIAFSALFSSSLLGWFTLQQPHRKSRFPSAA